MNHLEKKVITRRYIPLANKIIFVLIGLLFTATLAESIYLFEIEFFNAFLFSVLTFVIYLILGLVLLQKRTVRVLRRKKGNPIKEIAQEINKEGMNQSNYIASTKTSTYHRNSCRLAKSIKPKYLVANDSKSFFQKQKYKACKICKP